MNTATTLTDRCRLALPRFQGHVLVLVRTVPADVRAVLEERGLVDEHFSAGYLKATRRADGYIADPSTFDA